MTFHSGLRTNIDESGDLLEAHEDKPWSFDSFPLSHGSGP